MNTKHDEFSVEVPDADLIMSFVVNFPIVTCEITKFGAPQKLMSWGMAYCRPMDKWNPEVGVRLATISAVKKVMPEGTSLKESSRYFMGLLEPVLIELHENAKLERKKEMENIKAYLREECGECSQINTCAVEIYREG